MASSGLVMLLLMLVSFLISSQSDPQASKHKEHHLLLKRANKNIVAIGKDTKTLLNKVEPFIALIPDAGPFLSAFIKLLLGGRGDGEKIISLVKAEFKKLHEKLDNQLITMTWNTWASGPYQEAESNIKLAWKNLNELSAKCKSPCSVSKNKEQYMNLFKKLHSNLAFSPDKLHMLLTTQQPSFITDFKTLFTDHVRCHEKAVKDFGQLITELMIMSNTVSLFYYSLHGVNKAEEIAQMTFEVISVMSEIHRFCILKPEKYIIKDVIDLIDENQDRQKLAKDIKKFLEKTYSNYDWIVVAFITRHSKYSRFYNKFLNRHYLAGFTEVTKGEVSVAVAKQMKGNHVMAEQVIKGKIQSCLSKITDCKKIIESLNKCPQINGKPLSDYYTAVHAYVSKSHDSAEVEQDEFIDAGRSTPPYIYTGDCKKYNIQTGGHFRVLIRSDEDLKKDNPCKNVNCGGTEKGKCVTLPNVQKAVCQCNKDYMGSRCEISLKEFTNAIRVGMPKV
ncbi:uncharacterized protein LOC124863904 [Girardinichthys multiradiatus]|uniref:uncharacterized protein LOC124862391 n=1 Tax=Girardinichthys multiradiatus TaxID=208333 RepID=UPI001FAD6A0C|nr:uncharacterized protein LOC124862391 [Girardinichthys multiradiatus]XP_047214415.1 uncharacterized protein LOC124863904 [Girardinichthys multiradiatus]